MVVGIDPGLVRTAIWNGKNGMIIKTEKKDGIGARLAKIYGNVRLFLRRHKEVIKSVYLEELAFAYRSRSMSNLGAVNGIIKLAVYHELDHMKVEMVPSSTWKKGVLGFGKLDKKEVQERVESMFGKVFTYQDSYDAFCVWKYGIEKEKRLIK